MLSAQSVVKMLSHQGVLCEDRKLRYFRILISQVTNRMINSNFYCTSIVTSPCWKPAVYFNMSAMSKKCWITLCYLICIRQNKININGTCVTVILSGLLTVFQLAYKLVSPVIANSKTDKKNVSMCYNNINKIVKELQSCNPRPSLVQGRPCTTRNAS